MMDQRLLDQILSIPTAPFREQAVIKFMKDILTRTRVPHFSDPVGNIVVGVASPAEYRRIVTRGNGPVFLFIAHTDHPGFHGRRWLGERTLAIRWHGGSPTKHLNGAKVWASATREDGLNWDLHSGTLHSSKLNRRKSAVQSGLVTFGKSFRRGNIAAASLYGGFGFRKPVWRNNGLIYTKAADDLVGAFVILSLAIARRSRLGTTGNFLGLLTRAEEVGFIGTLEHLNLGWLRPKRREAICVSLETSRQLPGALVGRGPIVRLGDRATVFDASGVEYLTGVAKAVLGKRFQRRIMDGGTCEGTPANAYGLRTLALSVPLGNYHNQGFEGGPDSRGPLGPSPEFVNPKDVDGMFRLCLEILRRPPVWESVWSKRNRAFKKLMLSYRSLLRE